MNIGISGYRGRKGENGYEVPSQLLKSAYKFVSEEGLPLLDVSEVTSVVVGDDTGSDLLGLRLARDFNVSPIIKKPRWDDFSTPKEAAQARYEEVVQNSDVFILLRNEQYYGGNSIVDELSKSKIKILVYDYTSGSYFLSSGETIEKDLKSAVDKYTSISIDYPRIARSFIKRKCILLDTETTGTGKEDEVIEIAFVDGLSGHVYFDSRIKPERKCSVGATKVHGITNRMLAKCPTIAEVYPAFERFFDYPIVAYNSSFDYRLLDQSLRKKGIELPLHRFEDLMPLCSAKFGNRLKLEVVCNNFGIVPGTHSAASDAIALYEVMHRLAEDES